MVGIKAKGINDRKKPTMRLNLGGFAPEHQESLVIHHFGRALGLENEHQRPEFWDVLGKYLDVEKMKADPQVGSAAAYEEEWVRAPFSPGEQSVNSLLEYDPDSIMHYRLVLIFPPRRVNDVSQLDHELKLKAICPSPYGPISEGLMYTTFHSYHSIFTTD